MSVSVLVLVRDLQLLIDKKESVSMHSRMVISHIESQPLRFRYSILVKLPSGLISFNILQSRKSSEVKLRRLPIGPMSAMCSLPLRLSDCIDCICEIKSTFCKLLFDKFSDLMLLKFWNEGAKQSNGQPEHE